MLDCLPATFVKVNGDGLEQLCVRTCVARNLDLAEFTPRTIHELTLRAQSPDEAQHKPLLDLYGLFASEYDSRPVRVEDVPLGTFAQEYGKSGPGQFLHNHGALACLDGLLALVRDGGFILVNDYGTVETKTQEDFEHQRFADTTAVGLNFPLLKAYFAGKAASSPPSPLPQGARGQEGAAPSRSEAATITCEAATIMWLQPEEDDGRIYSRLLGRGLCSETKESFRAQFGKKATERAQEPWNAARMNLQYGRFEAALTQYHRALAQQPLNWLLMNEIALFVIYTLRNPKAGRSLAKEALRLNPTCSAELWNTYGDAYFELGFMPEARKAYRRALEINPRDVRAHYNLIWVLVQNKEYAAALETISKALVLDETGAYFERLLKKQAEVLGRLAQLQQLKMFLFANRASQRAAAGPKQETNPLPAPDVVRKEATFPFVPSL